MELLIGTSPPAPIPPQVCPGCLVGRLPWADDGTNRCLLCQLRSWFEDVMHDLLQRYLERIIHSTRPDVELIYLQRMLTMIKSSAQRLALDDQKGLLDWIGNLDQLLKLIQKGTDPEP